MRNKILLGITALLTLVIWTGCNDKKSYAELLQDENKSVNRFLADQRVGGDFDKDNYEVGEDAPYYRMDEDGNIFMQIIKVGADEMAEDNQLVYFRYIRYNLSYYWPGAQMPSEGNADNIEMANTSFRYKNTTLTSSSQWGAGIQVPLEFLPLGSEVKLVIKSQFGWTNEIAYVNPYLYHIRYYRSQI